MDGGTVKKEELSDNLTELGDVKKRQPIPIPEGMTEEELKQKFEDIVNNYNNNVPYKPVPPKSPASIGKDYYLIMLGYPPGTFPGFGNSNSFVGSALRRAGIHIIPKMESSRVWK